MALTKSQRVNAIQQIAAHLESQDWTIVDLTLKQFSLPTSDQWSGGIQSYVVKMIGDAEDDDLIELSEHFGIPTSKPVGAPAAEPPPPYWEEGKLRVFISHLTAHRDQAASLQTALSGQGMSSFVAHNDINPTVEWQIEIETALTSCDLLVALIHPEFVKSHWCDQEIGFALGRGVPVFTVRCGADPYGFVSRFQAFNGNGKQPWQIASELFEAALVHKKIQQKMADVLVNLFANSGSYAAAKTRMGYLEKLTIWNPTYSARLKQAVQTNDQVRDSWGVPDQVETLIKKWN